MRQLTPQSHPYSKTLTLLVQASFISCHLSVGFGQKMMGEKSESGNECWNNGARDDDGYQEGVLYLRHDAVRKTILC